jgi:NDP-sugar pyrophosphorylase family protein
MKAIVLAGGKGERLGDETRTIPKPMIKLDGKPVLEHIIDQLKAARVREIYICIHHLGGIIRDHFDDGSRFGVSINYHETSTLSGTASVVKDLEGKVDKEQFYVIYGDGYSDYDFEELHSAHVDFKQKHTAIVGTIGLWQREDVEGKVGIVGVGPDGLINNLIERPTKEQIFPDYLVNMGHYILEPTIFAHIPVAEPSDFAEHIFPKLVNNHLLCGIELTGELKPYDTKALLASLRKAAADL